MNPIIIYFLIDGLSIKFNIFLQTIFLFIGSSGPKWPKKMGNGNHFILSLEMNDGIAWAHGPGPGPMGPWAQQGLP